MKFVIKSKYMFNNNTGMSTKVYYVTREVFRPKTWRRKERTDSYYCCYDDYEYECNNKKVKNQPNAIIECKSIEPIAEQPKKETINMTREEYEAKKAEIVEKKNALNKELDELCESFHEEELKEYKEKFDGKYVLFYEHELRKNGKGPIIPSKYTIYEIKKVTFVGYGFINVDGIAYDIVRDEWNVKLTKRIHDEFRSDLRISSWEKPDKFLTKDEFNEIIEDVRFRFSNLCDEIEC